MAVDQVYRNWFSIREDLQECVSWLHFFFFLGSAGFFSEQSILVVLIHKN